ncbi:ComF family protein [Mycolicibacterium sp.]|jgi:predicted amidophosphoribosyltransferase|uniref:ComF family protein n=1 Tax=Mycolicibacterium sp. TaxID=2320850 RepID=UPI0028A9FBF5|nr:ComF family protein [Mycolicibacterium sp.]
MLDLILPLECGGCGAPCTRWCDACATALQVHSDEPHLVTPRVDPGVPVFALGRYAGPRRHAIVAVKEHGRRDLVAPLSRALALGIHRLAVWGIVATPLTVVPAPTRRAAARRRGGDPVARVADTATRTNPDITSVHALRTVGRARDSVGLTTTARERNIAGRVRLTGSAPAGEVLLVDDIVTTGATAREAVRVLRAAGSEVSAVLTLAHA